MATLDVFARCMAERHYVIVKRDIVNEELNEQPTKSHFNAFDGFYCANHFYAVIFISLATIYRLSTCTRATVVNRCLHSSSPNEANFIAEAKNRWEFIFIIFLLIFDVKRDFVYVASTGSVSRLS